MEFFRMDRFTLIALSILASCRVLGFNSQVQFTLERFKFSRIKLAKQQLGEYETLNFQKQHGHDFRNVCMHDLTSLGPLDYRKLYDLQKVLVRNQLERLKVEFHQEIPQCQFLQPLNNTLDRSNQSSKGVDCSVECALALAGKQNIGLDSILFLEHNPVFTLGTASDPVFIKYDQGFLARAGIDLIRIERGGEVTYHGPGQLVVYPILDLRGYKQDLHWYMRALEEAVLLALNSIGIKCATRENDVTGVWVNEKKIAALGVKVKRWVTMHGLSVNVDARSLSNFEGIVPCGLEGREVDCVNSFLDEPITVEEFAIHVKEALQQVFHIKLVKKIQQQNIL